MEDSFDVFLDGRTAGKVDVRREGLYIRVNCRCTAPEGKIWRLFAGQKRLGVLVPQGDGLVLETRVPAKHLDTGALFLLRDSPDPPERDRFVPLEEDRLFPELQRVRNSVFARRDGIAGLILREKS